MAEKKYYIRVPEALVEVSEEIYKTTKYMERHDRTLKEKETRNRVFSYDSLDTDELLGIEMIPDSTAASVEEQVIAKLMSAKLKSCMELLTEEERNLIYALFYEERTEKEIGKQIGISQKAVSKRLHRILKKLKNSIER